MLAIFILLLSACGIFCDPFRCMVRERESRCDHSLIPKDFPDTVEELQTMCSNFITFGTCMVEVYEYCGYSDNRMLKAFDFAKSLCDEDDAIYKVISSNLGCITPVARKVNSECNASRYIGEKFADMWIQEEQITNNYERLEIADCVFPLWRVTCGYTVIGVHCGSVVKDAVKKVLEGTNASYDSCTSEILEELEPLRQTYESVVEAEQKLVNAIRKRK